MTAKVKVFEKPNFNNELVLYFHPYNFYSQKILIILYEKQIDFTPYIVDLSNGEQYSDWFLNLNPKGDVPVLQDGCFIIPDSSQIISYLEGKYKIIKELIYPQNSTPKQIDKLKYIQNVINRLPIGAITLGSFIHTDLKLNPKPPFIGPVRKSFLRTNEKVNEILKHSANDDKYHSISLMKKMEFQEHRRQIVYSRDDFQKLLNAVEAVLKYVENEIKSNKTGNWISTEEITVTDISFGLLLYRLYVLGFKNYFWANGKMPNVEKFLLNFKTRESLQKSLPSSLAILKEIWSKTPSNYKISAGVLGMAMFAASTLAHKVG